MTADREEEDKEQGGQRHPAPGESKTHFVNEVLPETTRLGSKGQTRSHWGVGRAVTGGIYPGQDYHLSYGGGGMAVGLKLPTVLLLLPCMQPTIVTHCTAARPYIPLRLYNHCNTPGSGTPYEPHPYSAAPRCTTWHCYSSGTLTSPKCALAPLSLPPRPYGQLPTTQWPHSPILPKNGSKRNSCNASERLHDTLNPCARPTRTPKSLGGEPRRPDLMHKASKATVKNAASMFRPHYGPKSFLRSNLGVV